MRVVVMAKVRIAEPGKARQALGLRQHVGSNPGLARSESVDQQVRLDLGDPRPVAHVAFALGLRDGPVFRRQLGNRALEVRGSSSYIDPGAGDPYCLERIRAWMRFREPHPECSSCAPPISESLTPKMTVEQIVGNHLGRQGLVAARPNQVAVDVVAVGFLANPDLNRAEPRLRSNGTGQDMIEVAPPAPRPV